VPQDGRSAVEWEIRQYAERLARKFHPCGVPLDDVDIGPATAKAVCQSRIKLDRNDAAGCTSELRGQAATPRPEIENELIGANRSVAHKLRRESV
jgi:hypothetical protein